MIKPQKMQKVIFLLVSIFAGALLMFFVTDNLDALMLWIGIDKSFSGRNLLVRQSLSGAIFLICAFFVWFSLNKISQPAILNIKRITQTIIKKRSENTGRFFIALFCVSGLTLFVILAGSFRIICDDFDFLLKLEKLGMQGAIINHYLTWSGRYMQYPMQFFLAHIPQRTLFPAMMFLTIAAYWASFNMIFSLLSQKNHENEGRNRPRIFQWKPSLLALLCLAYFLLLCPNLFTSHLWYIGWTTFAFGIGAQTLSLAFLYWALRDNHASPASFIGALLCAIVANGTNEMTALSMTILSIMFLFFNPFYASLSPKRKKMLQSYALINALALIFMISAPGNFARMSHADHLAEEGLYVMLYGFVINMIKGYGMFLSAILQRAGLAAAFCLSIFLVGVGITLDEEKKRFLSWGAIVFFIASFGCIAANAFLYDYLPLRSLSAPLILLIIALSFLMLRLAAACPRNGKGLLYEGVAGICCFFCCLGFYLTYADSLRTFAAECDYRDEQLRNADPAAEVVQTCRINFFFGELQEVEKDADFIINRQIADYYGLKRIIAVDDCQNHLPAKHTDFRFRRDD